MFKPEGIVAPVLTSLDGNEKFNPGAYKEYINYLIDAGIHGIFPLGTNGEFYAFNQQEKLEAQPDPFLCSCDGIWGHRFCS